MRYDSKKTEPACIPSCVCLQPRLVLEGHTGYVVDVACSGNGRKIASASYDGTARVWGADSGVCLCVLEGHKGVVQCCAWVHGRNNLVVTGSADGTAAVWDTRTGAMTQEIDAHPDHSLASLSLYVEPDLVRYLVVWSLCGFYIASKPAQVLLKCWSGLVWSDMYLSVCLSAFETTIEYLLHRYRDLISDALSMATVGTDNHVRLWDVHEMTYVLFNVRPVHAHCPCPCSWFSAGPAQFVVAFLPLNNRCTGVGFVVRLGRYSLELVVDSPTCVAVSHDRQWVAIGTAASDIYLVRCGQHLPSSQRCPSGAYRH